MYICAGEWLNALSRIFSFPCTERESRSIQSPSRGSKSSSVWSLTPTRFKYRLRNRGLELPAAPADGISSADALLINFSLAVFALYVNKLIGREKKKSHTIHYICLARRRSGKMRIKFNSVFHSRARHIRECVYGVRVSMWVVFSLLYLRCRQM